MQTGWSEYLFNFGSPLQENGALHKHDFRAASLIHGRAAASAEITTLDLGHRSARFKKSGHVVKDVKARRRASQLGCTFFSVEDV